MSRVLRSLTLVFVVLSLLAGLAVPFLQVGLHHGVAQAETTVFIYSGTGSGNTSPFTTSASPWKVVITANWTGTFTADICYQSSGNTARYSALGGTVVAGETYYDLIYGLVGSYFFHVTNAPANGAWTIWVVEDLDFPTPLPGSVFTDSGTGAFDTWPFTITASPWRVGYITDWTGSFTVDVCSVSTGNTVRYSAISKSVTAGQMNEDWVYGLTGSYFFHVAGVPANGSWTIGIDDTFPPDRPLLALPDDAALVSDNTPTFDWTDVADPSGVTYSLQIDDNADFSSLALGKTGLTASQYTLTDNETLAETTFHWRVQAIDGMGDEGVWTDPWTFTVAPQRPSNVSPTDNATATILTPTLQSSAFSDPIVGDTHAASQWQVRSAAGSYSTPTFDSSTDNSNLTQVVLPSAVLGGNTTYYWHVRYMDNHGAWSNWSTETSFTTLDRPPNQPSNSSPRDGYSSTALTVTLQASAFSDPDTGDRHAASQWQVRTSYGSYSTPNYDSGTQTSALIQFTLTWPSGGATYYWHVRHQDNHGTWSDWSTETSFTLRASVSPDRDQTPQGTSSDGVPWWVWPVVAGAATVVAGILAWAYIRRRKPAPTQTAPQQQEAEPATTLPQPEKADVPEVAPQSLCITCGQALPADASFCENCGASVGKAAPEETRGVSMAAWITIGIMAFAALFNWLGAFQANTTEEGTFEWFKFLIECTAFIPLCLVIYVVAGVLHLLLTRRWIDFRGRTGRFLR